MQHHALPRRITADANGVLDHGFADLPASPSLTNKSKGPSRLLKGQTLQVRGGRAHAGFVPRMSTPCSPCPSWR
eukprot:1151168-Pelagomonas_calceolata.AAC.1